MAQKGSLGVDLVKEVWKRSVPRVRLYRLPRLPGRVSWLVPFLRERLPQRFQPEALQEQARERLLREGKAVLLPEELPEEVPEGPQVILAEPAFAPIAPLPEQTILQGSKGRYQIHARLGQRGIGQLYRAEQLLADRPVVVKEYELSADRFTLEQGRQQQHRFLEQAGMHLADGRMQDVRLIQPWDAFADERQRRCYLVLPGELGALPSLRAYLAQWGWMTEIQVRRLLSQTLQTLACLHGQKYRLASGTITPGLAHGNLSVDSVLVAGQGHDFFAYLCDLALWEHLFNPTGKIPETPTPEQDLTDLGYLARQLLGLPTMIDGEQTPDALEGSLNFAQLPDGNQLSPGFQAYLQRLAGTTIPFGSARAARQALLQLPAPHPLTLPAAPDAPQVLETSRQQRSYKPFWIAGGLATLALLAGVGGFWWMRSRSTTAASATPLSCCVANVTGIPEAPATYTTPASGSWQYIWQQPNLVSQGKTLAELLQAQQPNFQLQYRPLPPAAIASPQDNLVDWVRSQTVDFAIGTPLSPLPPDIATETLAYDGLAVVVAFSYDQRDQSLPTALAGQITFEQLRQLYTGEVRTWDQLDPRLPALPVQVYAPADVDAIEIFEQTVLQTPAAIERFRNRLIAEESLVQTEGIPVLPTFPLLRAVIQDFETSDVGAIAFAPLSQVFGQCAVYPLALVDDRSPVQAVQPLQQDTGTPITPQTNLCDDKGSYFPDINAFRNGTYPLAYPLAVMYRWDNSQPPFGRKFAELFTTAEGQRWLSEAGLVPLQPLE